MSGHPPVCILMLPRMEPLQQGPQNMMMPQNGNIKIFSSWEKIKYYSIYFYQVCNVLRPDPIHTGEENNSVCWCLITFNSFNKDIFCVKNVKKTFPGLELCLPPSSAKVENRVICQQIYFNF